MHIIYLSICLHVYTYIKSYTYTCTLFKKVLHQEGNYIATTQCIIMQLPQQIGPIKVGWQQNLIQTRIGKLLLVISNLPIVNLKSTFSQDQDVAFFKSLQHTYILYGVTAWCHLNFSTWASASQNFLLVLWLDR